jgi:tetratricopeptide (TPR) repeat protein
LLYTPDSALGEAIVEQGIGRYVAFLSYSHKDAAQARWLHRRLESYRIPRRLAGTEGERGPVPARLTPIFRDREELPAAGDLSEQVRAALAASAALVILCSPNSAASLWVAKEIAAFRELHTGRPILAAIVEGEPEQCFPDGLAAGGAEPLAADLRPGRDGRRLGFLKLVAGLTGLPLDALVQRDAQRRLRRVTAVTAAALVAVLLMAVMTALALTARAEAQRQRAEAEGLVEFMLTDLREKLREVGRLDVLGSVNDRAIAYYAHQGDLERLPDDSLERRARVLQAMGEDDSTSGRKGSALARFREAYVATAEGLARHPNDPRAIFAHAQSEYWLGHIAYFDKDWPRTEARWSAYKALADRLMQVDPDNPTSLREEGYATGNLCTLEIDRKGVLPNALKACSAAAKVMERIVARSPGDRKAMLDLGNRYAWLGGAWEAAGKPQQALAAFEAQEKLLEPLVRRFPRDARLQDQWMRTLMTLAEFHRRNRRPQEASLYAGRALAVANSLVALDPANAQWKKWKDRLDRLDRAHRRRAA